MSRQSDALAKFLFEKNITQADLAKKLGLSPGMLSSILSGRYGISKKVAYKLHQLYGMNTIFLIEGEGDIFAPESVRKMGDIINSTIKAEGDSQINIMTDAAALRAENERLKDEIKFLRSLVETRQ